MEEKNDSEIIEAAKQDKNAFGRIYEKYVWRVYRFLWSRVGKSREIAEDLVQETFLRAFAHLPKIRAGYASFLGYLMKIAKNLLVSYYRKKKSISIEQVPETPIETLPALQSAIDREIIWKEIAALRDIEKRAITMHYREGMPIAEIAKSLGRSENAAKLLLSRARKKLKAKLKK